MKMKGKELSTFGWRGGGENISSFLPTTIEIN
jgi:hypothetical protein